MRRNKSSVVPRGAVERSNPLPARAAPNGARDAAGRDSVRFDVLSYDTEVDEFLTVAEHTPAPGG
ncbi:hypothetical protein ACFV29_30445 [Streptomyces sp. NPDC059690]|uniref:hypothetical protein n=1 Tax=Streptomyces sp. NPDC059690 TaxID=3346907 RepID=UPI00368E6F9D